jgi:protein-tyrosine phosphatase
MNTDVIPVGAAGAAGDGVRRAVEVLTSGGIVAFPTETVYGVGARMDLPDSVARLRAVKERSDHQPLTVHVAARDEVFRFVPQPGRVGRRLVRKAWPGPVTLVLPIEVGAGASSGQIDVSALHSIAPNGSIGMRCPDETTATAILLGVGAPVVATSANRAGRPAPTTAEGVRAELGGRIDLIIDGGPTRYGRPSTIVRVDGERYRVLRVGVYDERMIEQLASYHLLFVCTGNTCRSPMAAAMARSMLAEKLGIPSEALADAGIRIESAGTFAGAGPAADHAVAVMADRGIDLSAHRCRGLSPELVHSADRVYVMTRSHRDAVLDLVPGAESRVTLLAGEEELGDPFGGSRDAYQRSADAIEAAVKKRLEEIDP